ncbi:hypothetical protein RchiOBHm_Chr1g0363751 [Rosa chinensis]|uniref:Uncharacterized protein n=1 Tax=Rosa chinensis TaxID=74649 RepID=A0A2P6SJJ6_ROSCH|nr:hypothetical protein RchiOBHm_Chr1g0363751 [Rosa chinensis]
MLELQKVQVFLGLINLTVEQIFSNWRDTRQGILISVAKGLISVSNQYSVSNLHLITQHEVIELPRRETKLKLSGDRRQIPKA